MKVPFGIHSVTAQMILSFIGVVILTAVAVGVPALWLLREQLQYQAWSQVDQGQRAANSLYTAKQSEIDSLAILTAQRPTLRELLIRSDPEDLEIYLEALKQSLDIDILSVCDLDHRTLYNTQPSLPVDPCSAWNLDGYQVLPVDPNPQIWLSARYPIAINESNASEVIVGKLLDNSFVLQLLDQTGLENSLKVGNQYVATSFPGGTESISLFHYRNESDNPDDAVLLSTFEVNNFPYYSARFKLNEGEIWADVALRVSPILATEQRLVLILIFSILFVTAMVSILGVLLARRISQPLVQLAKNASEFGDQDLSQPVRIDTRVWEVQQVAGALERARIDLQQTLSNLEREKAWVDHLLESIVEGIITLDHEGCIRYFSAGAEQITGWSREQVFGRSFDEVFRLAEAQGPSSDLIPVPGTKKKMVIAISDERQAVLSFTGARIAPAEAGDTQIALVFRDISEEELIRRILGDFLANIAHEFKTPLSSAAASTELLVDQLQDLNPDELHELLTSLHLGILGLQTLVDNLLESASIEAGRFWVSPQLSDLGKIIAEAIQIMQPLLEKYGQRLIVELPADVPMILADERRIVQVLVNLVSNASKYGPSDEEITIKAEMENDRVRITVADRGPGIPLSQQGQVFRRFMYPGRLGKSEKVGAGLGLSVVKATIEAHGGQVGVTDRKGGGSIFWFSLPKGSNE